MKHIIDKVCSCEYCHMLDTMFGDPLLNQWEKSFVKNVSRWGWRDDYTTKQKTVIRKIFKKQQKKYQIEREKND